MGVVMKPTSEVHAVTLLACARQPRRQVRGLVPPTQVHGLAAEAGSLDMADNFQQAALGSCSCDACRPTIGTDAASDPTDLAEGHRPSTATLGYSCPTWGSGRTSASAISTRFRTRS